MLKNDKLNRAVPTQPLTLSIFFSSAGSVKKNTRPTAGSQLRGVRGCGGEPALVEESLTEIGDEWELFPGASEEHNFFDVYIVGYE